MSKKVRGFLGASIELISPVAKVVYFPGVAELFTIIERIVALIDTARYNREALPYMRMYMTEVKQTIRDNSETINEEYTPTLMKALKNWEKFLVQYTKPKMVKLLTILNADKIDRKIRDLFTDLDNALNAANLRVTLENNKGLKKILGITEKMDEHMMDLDNKMNAIQIDITAVKDAVTEKVKTSFITAAICHGVPLSQERIDDLTISPEWINPVPNAQPNGDGPTKVVYCGGNYAAKVKIANANDDISKYWVQAFISSRLNTDLFMKNYGILLDGGTYYMITEWPGKGTLSEYLKAHRIIPWTLKIRWVIRLARALAFCHNKYILHHDIRSHNVIVDTNDNVKLANYHRARGMKDITTSVAEETDGVRWLCPEKTKDGALPYSTSADVYSFGMLMWEITSHEIPFPDKSIVEVYTLLKNSDGFNDQDAPRPPIVPGTPEKYASIMQKCWRQIPGSRPTMQYVVRKLEKLEKTYEKPYDNASLYATDTTNISSGSFTEYDPYAPTHPHVTLQTARELHCQKNYKEAFKQFKILADKAEPDPEANFYVGRYLIDSNIQFNRGAGGSVKDPNVGVSYLEVAEDLGCSEATQYRAQEKMAAAKEIRKQLQDTGDETDAEVILDRMKTECLPLFRNGASHGNLRCMKDLADYGAKLGDKQSYVDGLRMLDDVIAKTKDPKQKAKAQDFLMRLQQHKNVFVD
ncbi:6157_t:CDS:2 [Paraglomus brasilianum]|uniref:6157_t:CDS:1 n=1 Tax=Paraglomus brasilianum TaxID=144538 RepID=A0A9N9F4P4_9GLOM|nr:6157_t:CDS:2 [Paraglomus brasilianum]